MLEYHKLILEKVSFDSLLFDKELGKSFKSLAPKEKKDFAHWCIVKFKLTKKYIRSKMK